MVNDRAKKNYLKIRESIPTGIDIVVAAKARNAQSIKEVIDAGAKIIGGNYIQETQKVREELGNLAQQVSWHMIGHLQTNKAERAVELFDMIETIDSIKLAQEIDKRCKEINKIMPILIEINSGREEQKSGVLPEECMELIKEIYNFSNIKIMGLMTMGPRFGEPEKARVYFRETRKIFKKVKELNLPNINMEYLSMGMSNTYRIAIEEGSNLVRIGEAIFGKRNYKKE